MKRHLIPLVLLFAATGCTDTPDQASAPTSDQAPVSTGEAMGPGNYAFVTRSGAEGVVSIPSTDGVTSIAVSVDNSFGTDPVSLISVTIQGTDGQEFIFSNPTGEDVPPLSDENLVFTGEEIPSSFNGVSVQEFEGTSVNAIPVE